MMWYQNSFLLDPTDRRSMFSNSDKYILKIKNFQQSDFGNYRFVSFISNSIQFSYKIYFFIAFRKLKKNSCVADNALGRTKKYIEISGRPGHADFRSPQYSGHLDQYNLTWIIESIPPLEEVRILYRKLVVSYIFYVFLCDSYGRFWSEV